MASTTFTTGTVIPSAWLNDVNSLVYTLFAGATTAAQARTAISAAQSGANTDITSLASPAVAAATATTQSSSDNTTKVATTAMVQSAVTAGLATVPYDNTICDFRLTLTSGTPVTTTDVTGATTIYCTPFRGNRIALYDGSSTWNVRNSAEFSLALGTLTSGKPYDVFCYDNSGTPTLEFLVWTNDTTRATALTTQNGVLVKTGAPTRRYMGTFYTTSTTQTEDSKANRYLWNYYNRVDRKLEKHDTTANWNYTTATWRQSNNAAANQVNILVGWSEDLVNVTVTSAATNSGGSTAVNVGVGLDSTTVNSATIGKTDAAWNTTSGVIGVAAFFCDPITVGKHYLAMLEISAALGTTTWYGSGDPRPSGLVGVIKA